MSDLSRGLRYGLNKTLDLEFSPQLAIADCSLPRATPLADPRAAIQEALRQPLKFPALAEATVAGDHVVLAVAPDVPAVGEVVAAVVESLMSGGLLASSISVLHVGEKKPAAESVSDQPRPVSRYLAALPEVVASQIREVAHDPEEKDSLAYLAATKDANPIHIHRLLTDADLVLPIGVLHTDESLGYLGIHGGLYPIFSDQETQLRFRVREGRSLEKETQRLREETAEVGWLLGVQCTLQIVPGPGEQLLHVLAGECQTVLKQGGQLCADAWRLDGNARAELILATIEGGPEQQTWENFARALQAATQVVTENGAIVLCTQLTTRPGPVLRSMTEWMPGDDLPKKVRRDQGPDGLAAVALAEAKEKAHVYLLSGLKQGTVENLGIGCVTSAAEIERLSRQFQSCMLLANAHQAVVAVAAE